MKAFNFVACLAVYCTLACLTTPAATLHVWQGSPRPAPPYGDWVSAAHAIQDAVDAANVGDLVLVTNGVYEVGGRAMAGPITNRVVIDKTITLLSLNGPTLTVIKGAGSPAGGGISMDAARCAYVGSNAVLSGFTLTDGCAWGGGGVWCEPNGVVTNCMLIDNAAYSAGGGAYGGMLYNCILTGNYTWGDDSGGGGVAEGSLHYCKLTGNNAYGVHAIGGGAYLASLYNCILTTNFAESGGGAMVSTLYNCVLSGNFAEAGGGVAEGTSYNCTITGNSARLEGGGVMTGTFYNCIIYANTAPSDSPNYYDSTNTIFNFCCTTPLPSNGVGNLGADPLSVDYVNGNLRLQANSPCLNVGNNAYVTTATDLDGRPRTVGGTVDMGAYEFQPDVSGAFIGWLQNHGLSTDGTADYTDPDHDGMNDWQEWVCGTDPTNPLSALHLLSAVPTGTNVIVTWQSVAGVNYSLEQSANLAMAFTPLATNIVGQAGTTSYADTNATGAGPFFYRVAVKSP